MVLIITFYNTGSTICNRTRPGDLSAPRAESNIPLLGRTILLRFNTIRNRTTACDMALRHHRNHGYTFESAKSLGDDDYVLHVHFRIHFRITDDD